MIDLNSIAQTAADKYAEGLDKYNENTTTDSAPLEEPNEKEEVDTSWLDSFSNRDRDRSEFNANDRVDTSIQPETLKEEAVFGGESSSTPEDVYDTSYLDEAFANFNTWQQKAEEDAKKGRQLAYTRGEVNKDYAAAQEALREAAKQDLPPKTQLALSQLAKKDPYTMSQEDIDAETSSILGDTTKPGSFSSKREKVTSEALDKFRDTAKKAQDIQKYGETATAGMSAQQEANKVYQTARENAGIAGMERAVENFKKAYEANPTDEMAAKLANSMAQLTKASLKVKEEVEKVSPNNKKATGMADSNVAEVYNKQTNDETVKKALERWTESLAPDTTAPTAPARPATPTDSSITNEFNEMFANPNTDSLEEYTGITKEELPDNVEEATGVDLPPEVEEEFDKAMEEGRVNKWQEIVRNTPFGRSELGAKVLDWIKAHPGELEVPIPSDKDSETEETNTQAENNEPTTVEPATTQGIETVLPPEVVANNPEALEDIQEFITNGDSGGLAEYLLMLLGSTALTVIEHAMLSGKENDPTLQEALKEVWERMPASEKSGLDKERISAINNAFKAEPSNLKAVGISSEDTSATNESDYNKGMTEQTNEIVSDRTKKYVLSNPWILAAIRKW